MESFSELKEKGNSLFINKEYEEAISSYEEALETEDPGLKAICYGNIAACYINLNDLNHALEYCNSSLEINPEYTKVRERKIRVLLDLNLPREAKEELEKGPINEKLSAEVTSKVEKQMEGEKEEMLGKLKDLGNTVLGKFGLSLNNFQVNQQEGGGYSINFKQ